MLTFSRLEKKGNIGNQLFQIASVIGIAKKNEQEFSFPKWSFSSYFQNPLPVTGAGNFIHFNEPCFEFSELRFDNGNYDLEGWFQSERYFDIPAARKYFSFRNDFTASLKQKFSTAFDRETILISIRRGDFVDHPDYFQLPSGYYLNALIDQFPNWQHCSLIVMSDDPAYCKFHFGFLDNVYFSEGLPAIAQLALASLCNHFIISNSTFSWWCAWLGEKPNSKIIRPKHYFTAEKRRVDNDVDYFPERWTMYDHTDKKIRLPDTAIQLEKKDELLNNYLFANLEISPAHIVELSGHPPVRTLNWVFINNAVPPPLALYVGVQNLSKQKGGSLFFQKGSFLQISRLLDRPLFMKQLDFGVFSRQLRGNEQHNDKIIFTCIAENQGQIPVCSFEDIEASQNPEFKIFYTYAGKIKGFPECKYYLATQKRKAVFKLKQFVKKLIRYRKK